MTDNNSSAPVAPTAEPSANASDSWDTPQVKRSEPKDGWGQVNNEQPKVNPEASTAKAGQGQGQQEEALKKAKKWLTAKVNGKEEKVDEETLIRDYQKYRAADEKFQKASQAEKSVKQFMEALQKDPMTVLNNPNLPIDRKKLAEEWLYSEIQRELETQDPRDQKVKEYEEELAKYKQKEEEEARTKQEQAYQETVSKRKEELGALFSEAMKKSALSKHPETAAATLREMALYYRAAREQGETPDAGELAAHVEQKYYKGLFELANTLEGDELVDFLGPQIIKKLRTYDLAQLTKKKTSAAGRNEVEAKSEWTPTKQGTQSVRQTVTPQDMKERIRKQLLGK